MKMKIVNMTPSIGSLFLWSFFGFSLAQLSDWRDIGCISYEEVITPPFDSGKIIQTIEYEEMDRSCVHATCSSMGSKKCYAGYPFYSYRRPKECIDCGLDRDTCISFCWSKALDTAAVFLRRRSNMDIKDSDSMIKSKNRLEQFECRCGASSNNMDIWEDWIDHMSDIEFLIPEEVSAEPPVIFSTGTSPQITTMETDNDNVPICYAWGFIYDGARDPDGGVNSSSLNISEDDEIYQREVILGVPLFFEDSVSDEDQYIASNDMQSAELEDTFDFNDNQQNMRNVTTQKIKSFDLDKAIHMRSASCGDPKGSSNENNLKSFVHVDTLQLQKYKEVNSKDPHLEEGGNRTNTTNLEHRQHSGKGIVHKKEKKIERPITNEFPIRCVTGTCKEDVRVAVDHSMRNSNITPHSSDVLDSLRTLSTETHLASMRDAQMYFPSLLEGTIHCKGITESQRCLTLGIKTNKCYRYEIIGSEKTEIECSMDDFQRRGGPFCDMNGAKEKCPVTCAVCKLYDRSPSDSMAYNSWPSNNIPYYIDKNIKEEHSGDILYRMRTILMEKAANVWKEKTCINFYEIHEKPVNTPFMHVVMKTTTEGRPTGCSVSPPGYPSNAPFISLVNIGSCGTSSRLGSIIHELGHVLGKVHTHMRPDRDKYIKMNWNKIIPKFKGNFFISPYSHTGASGLYEEYDFGSIMHYSPSQGYLSGSSTDGMHSTFNVLDDNHTPYKIGQRIHLSKTDIDEINNIYKCTEYMNQNVLGVGDNVKNTLSGKSENKNYTIINQGSQLRATRQNAIQAVAKSLVESVKVVNGARMVKSERNILINSLLIVVSSLKELFRNIMG